MAVHLDTDFLIRALSSSGPERERLVRLASSSQVIEMSAIAWYEFCRGPRTPEQLAVARCLLAADGVIPFSEPISTAAGEVFRQLGSPRRRAADIAIDVTAALRDAKLLSCNERDFAGIPGLSVEAGTSPESPN